MGSLDGVLFGMSEIAIRSIEDGTSNTVLVGEALHDVEGQESEGANRESGSGSRKDHWYFGGDDPDINNDLSEAVGSTAVPINFQNSVNITAVCRNPTSLDCQKAQLAFGSAHPGGAQIVRGDGSVDFMNEDIDAVTWSDMGTRASQVPVQQTGGGR